MRKWLWKNGPLVLIVTGLAMVVIGQMGLGE